MQRFKQFFIVVFLPLSVSLFIYIIFRPTTTIVNVLLQDVLGFESVRAIRSTISAGYHPSYFVVQNLPGGLWIMSITALAMAIYFQKKKLGKVLLFMPLLYGIGLEICQKNKWTDGTFDWLDVLVVPVAWLLGILIGSFLFREKPLPIRLGVGMVLVGFLSLIMGDCFG